MWWKMPLTIRDVNPFSHIPEENISSSYIGLELKKLRPAGCRGKCEHLFFIFSSSFISSSANRFVVLTSVAAIKKAFRLERLLAWLSPELFFCYFAPSLKDAHSVPSHLVGAQSQQPTLMESREQQFWAPEWYAQVSTEQRILVLQVLLSFMFIR